MDLYSTVLYSSHVCSLVLFRLFSFVYRVLYSIGPAPVLCAVNPSRCFSPFPPSVFFVFLFCLSHSCVLALVSPPGLYPAVI